MPCCGSKPCTRCVCPVNPLLVAQHRSYSRKSCRCKETGLVCRFGKRPKLGGSADSPSGGGMHWNVNQFPANETAIRFGHTSEVFTHMFKEAHEGGRLNRGRCVHAL
jgi:hypothetical protein